MSQPVAVPSLRARALGLRFSATTAGAAALVAGTGFAHGGYFPEPWGWATLGCAWSAATVLLTRREVVLSRLAGAAAGLLLALTAWTAASAAWSLDVTQTALEAQRTALYATAFLAGAICAGRHPGRLLRGTWFAIVLLTGWALLTRLVPDRWGVYTPVAGYRLFDPIGYWNSLGLLAGMGALLALGLAARAGTRIGRALAAASLPVLASALYFTFSRGAWIALACGLVVLVAADRRRLQLAAVLLATAPFTAAAVWLGSRRPGLTTLGSPMSDMTQQGHRQLLVVLVASLATLVAVFALAAVDRELALPPRLLRPAQVAFGVILLAAVVGVTARYGSPATIARKGWDAFASAPLTSGPNLNNRLFHLSGTGRVAQWRIAWRQAEAHPALGTGAGTYAVYWSQHRPKPSRVVDVHNLYLETLAELGPVGLALLLGMLALPLVGAWRVRAQPLTAAALAVYVAFLLHAAVDWDWEIAAVSLAALLVAASLQTGGTPLTGRLRRGPVLGASLLLAAGAVYMIAMRIPLHRLDTALADGRLTAAIHDVRDASALAPWSSEPYLTLGEAELNAGLTGDAWAQFRIAATKDPNNWVAWYDLARASIGVERTHALSEARRLNPLEPELRSLGPRP